MRFLAIVGLCFVVLSAAQAAAAERRVAMVVGNADYQYAGKLRNPLNDAADIAASLRSLGFDVIDATDRSSRQFEEDIETFANASQNADVALFYYSGHAMQLAGANYLLPIDFDADTEMAVKRQAFNLSDIVEQMEAAAKVSLVFLDACRNNPLADALKAKLTSKGRSAELGRGLARVATGNANTMIVFATAPGTIAADGTGRNSPFTQAMLQYLPAPGVEIETMMKRVTSTVEAETGRKQQPERLSKLTIEFYFSPGDATEGATAAAPADDRLAGETAFWQAVQSSTSADDFQDYLDGVRSGRFTGLFTPLAERRLSALKKAGKEETALVTPEVKPARSSGADPSIAEISAIVTKGMNGNDLVQGTFRRTGKKSWEETNSQTQGSLKFTEVKTGKTEFTLFDESRNLYLKVDLAGRWTYWRTGDSKNWNRLYKVMAVN